MKIFNNLVVLNHFLHSLFFNNSFQHILMVVSLNQTGN